MSYPKKKKVFEIIQWENVERVDGDHLAGPYIKYLHAIDAVCRAYDCKDFDQYEFWIVERKDKIEWYVHFVPKAAIEQQAASRTEAE